MSIVDMLSEIMWVFFAPVAVVGGIIGLVGFAAACVLFLTICIMGITGQPFITEKWNDK